MARDFENIHDLDDLNGDEIKALVVEHLRENNMVDVDEITVSVDHGTVVLAGRVGTDGEKLVAGHVVTDVLGFVNIRNDIVVDPVRRAESPVAMDEHLADEDQREGLLLGDRALPLEPESESRMDDIDHELYGTTDVGHAIADGTAWIPPESPTQEGFIEDPNAGEDH